MAVRAFGQYRSGMTIEDVRLCQKAVKTLFRNGTMPHSVLANKCLLGLENPTWRANLARMIDWKILVLSVSSIPSRSDMVSLTVDGKGWGIEYCGEEDLERDAESARQSRENNSARIKKEYEAADSGE